MQTSKSRPKSIKKITHQWATLALGDMFSHYKECGHCFTVLIQHTQSGCWENHISCRKSSPTNEPITPAWITFSKSNNTHFLKEEQLALLKKNKLHIVTFCKIYDQCFLCHFSWCEYYSDSFTSSVITKSLPNQNLQLYITALTLCREKVAPRTGGTHYSLRPPVVCFKFTKSHLTRPSIFTDWDFIDFLFKCSLLANKEGWFT